MSKKRKTVTLDPEVKAYLDAEGRNASETVNKLVKIDMGGDVVNEQLIKMRMENEKDRYEDAARKARGHLERYNQLKDRLDKKEEEKEEAVAEAREAFEGHEMPPDDPAVENYAKRANISPEQLIERVEQ